MTDERVAPSILTLAAYVPGKSPAELARERGVADAVKLASNESSFGPSPQAVEAIRTAAVDVHRYPDANGFALRQALSARHGCSMDEVMLGSGSNEILELCVRAFAGPGRGVVFGRPTFPTYRLASHALAAPFVEVPLRDALHHDVDAYLGAINGDTRLLFVANPNNPTGTHLGREALGRLLREVPASIVVVLDEAYADFADAPDYESAMAMRDARENLLVLRTFSKSHGLAALRVGYAVGEKGLIGYLNRVRAPFNAGALGQVAALASLDDAAHFEAHIAHNAQERARMSKAFAEAGLEVAPSQANFVLVRVGPEARGVYEGLLDRGVIVRPMGPPIESWLRISVGRSDENERCIRAMREVVDA